MDLQHLRGSDGTGEAVLAHVSAQRLPASTVLELDNVDNWNSKCIVLTGTPNANGFIGASGITVMYGHITAGDFIIDGFAPGYADNGNETTEVAIIKMTTEWADALVDILKIAHNDDGSLKDNSIDSSDLFTDSVDPVKRASESQVFDYVASGVALVGTGYGSTLAWTLSAGVVYINGKRLTYAGGSGSVTASKDTYFDLLDNSDGTAVLVNTGGNIVNNNVASPALAANSIRVGIIQSGANIASVAAINQGQEDKVLPIASSIPYQVTDSLGNLICPRDPNRRILGYRQIIASQGPTGCSTADKDVTGLSVPVIVPTGRKIILRAHLGDYEQTGGIDTIYGVLKIKESTTQYTASASSPNAANLPNAAETETQITPTAGLHTYKLAIAQNAGGPNYTLGASATGPSFLRVELA